MDNKGLRVNQMIRVREVRLIDDKGGQRGILPTSEALKIAKDRGIAGPLISVSSYCFKHPPVQILDFEARERVEAFIRGEVER